LTKTCHACKAEVPETHKGKCPSCGKQAGYHYVRNIVEVVNVNDFVKAELKKSNLDPKAISFTIDAILAKQEEIKKDLAPIAQILTGPKMQALSKQLSAIATSTLNLHARLSNLDIPIVTSTTETVEEAKVPDKVLEDAAKELSEIKKDGEENQNETTKIEKELAGIHVDMNKGFSESEEGASKRHLCSILINIGLTVVALVVGYLLGVVYTQN